MNREGKKAQQLKDCVVSRYLIEMIGIGGKVGGIKC